MRKLIASQNMTIDGFCDHTAVIADDELHNDAIELLKNADLLLFGRVTYQLMERSWPPIVKQPTGNKPMDEFAVLIENIPKVVFSRTLQTVKWKNTTLAGGSLAEDVKRLKQQHGKNMVVGSPTILIELMKLGLIDEYRFCVQPIVLGSGQPLFKNIKERINLRLIKSKPLKSGAVTLFYEPEEH